MKTLLRALACVAMVFLLQGQMAEAAMDCPTNHCFDEGSCSWAGGSCYLFTIGAEFCDWLEACGCTGTSSVNYEICGGSLVMVCHCYPL